MSKAQNTVARGVSTTIQVDFCRHGQVLAGFDNMSVHCFAEDLYCGIEAWTAVGTLSDGDVGGCHPLMSAAGVFISEASLERRTLPTALA